MDRLLTRARLPAAVLAAVVGLALAVPANAGDPAKGKGVFAAQCSMCHSDNKGGMTILGPNLYGVVGRKAGTLPGYPYSAGMKAAGFIWTTDQLKVYLPAPRNTVPGTKMSFAGLKNPTQLDDLVAFLDTLK